MSRIKEKYKKEILPRLKDDLGKKNIMAVPRVDKITINTGFGKMTIGKTAEEQKKIIDNIINDLALISGQKPSLTQAKKSIATFKVRKGMPMGAKTTLRKQKMYDFLERLVDIALPRSRDFKGIDPKSVDERGNLTIAIKEQICFPEISPEKTRFIFGFEVTITSTAEDREQGLELFKALGFPFKAEE